MVITYSSPLGIRRGIIIIRSQLSRAMNGEFATPPHQQPVSLASSTNLLTSIAQPAITNGLPFTNGPFEFAAEAGFGTSGPQNMLPMSLGQDRAQQLSLQTPQDINFQDLLSLLGPAPVSTDDPFAFLTGESWEGWPEASGRYQS